MFTSRRLRLLATRLLATRRLAMRRLALSLRRRTIVVLRFASTRTASTLRRFSALIPFTAAASNCALRVASHGTFFAASFAADKDRVMRHA